MPDQPVEDKPNYQPVISTGPVISAVIAPEIQIPAHLVGEVQSKLAYVDERIAKVTVSPAGDRIEINLHQNVRRSVLSTDPDSSSQAAISDITQKVQRVVLSMVKGAYKPKIQVLEDYMDRAVTYQDDPMTALMEQGQVSPEATGIFALGPLPTRLINYFESRFLELAAGFEAAPYRFPTLIPAAYLERANYFRAFPHSLSFVTHLREDLDVIDRFSQTAACDEHGLNTKLESFSQIQTLLSPAVCYHLYYALADKPLPDGKLVATAVGNCFRYEATNLSSLERLWNFNMREIIFVGSKEFVLDNRETARQRMSRIFEEIGLAYQVESANDPFFIGEFRKQAAFQSAFQLKFEIRARLPFKNSTLAVGSYNYHQDFFGRNLSIGLPDGSPAHTGCVAFGLERMAYAFLAQFGVESAGWPAGVREALQ